VLMLDKVADDVEPLLLANIGLHQHPVAAWRAATSVLSLCLGSRRSTVAVAGVSAAAGARDPACARRPCTCTGARRAAGVRRHRPRAQPRHPGRCRARAAAVCDLDPRRVAAATAYAPGARGTQRPTTWCTTRRSTWSSSRPHRRRTRRGPCSCSRPASMSSSRSRSPSPPPRPTKCWPGPRTPGCSPASTRTGGSTRTTLRCNGL
jgi:hypothetical protein